jgi:hypothetical protein
VAVEAPPAEVGAVAASVVAAADAEAVEEGGVAPWRKWTAWLCELVLDFAHCLCSSPSC